MDQTRFLLREGWGEGHLCTHLTPGAAPDMIRVRDDTGDFTDYVATSTRLVLFGREIGQQSPWGSVVSTDIRNPDKFMYTLPGGRIEPYKDDVRGEGDDPADESIKECLEREVDEEIKLSPGSYEYYLVGIRKITKERSSEHATMNGIVCVDAIFVGISMLPLGVCHTRNGETGDREVVPPHILLGNPREGSTARAMLPKAQQIALCMGIIAIEEILGDTLSQLSPELRNLVKQSQSVAGEHFKRSMWRDHTQFLIPEQ
jgi:ADP-ribose pyrophosphatase YjhB (NUDIX family)